MVLNNYETLMHINIFTWVFRKRGYTQVQKQHLALYEPCSGGQGSN